MAALEQHWLEKSYKEISKAAKVNRNSNARASNHCEEKYTQASQSHGSATFCRRSRTRFGRMRSVETIRHCRTADQCNDDVRGSLGIMHSRLDIHDSLMQYIRAALHKLTGVPISSNLARGKQHCTDCSQGTGHKKDDDGDDDDD
ncbi:hypothetical protein CDL15_Pgr026878 [Punica granatum]|uniref:Uncharacterized protein n=1 Tax=Punica granatum TaxID=22663 RepID=A0A218WLR4_PUNGR|nr:hypothetical protein CDL15_Pgr026878 [Punica granatum]